MIGSMIGSPVTIIFILPYPSPFHLSIRENISLLDILTSTLPFHLRRIEKKVFHVKDQRVSLKIQQSPISRASDSFFFGSA